MRKTTITHAGVLEGLGREFFPSVCTIQELPINEAAKVFDDFGHETTPWTDVASLVGIPCAIGRPASGRGGVLEVRGSDLSYATEAPRVALAGYYPGISVLMRAVVDGTCYGITAVEHDSRHLMTYLSVEAVTL